MHEMQAQYYHLLQKSQSSAKDTVNIIYAAPVLFTFGKATDSPSSLLYPPRSTTIHFATAVTACTLNGLFPLSLGGAQEVVKLQQAELSHYLSHYFNGSTLPGFIGA